MKLEAITTVLIFLLITNINAWTLDENSINLLIGSWACESGDCPDEEISFSIEEGIYTYNSWLHERPSATDGTWIIDKDDLTIECCDGLTYEYIVIRATETELVLRNAETAEQAVLSRVQSANVSPKPTNRPGAVKGVARPGVK